MGRREVVFGEVIVEEAIGGETEADTPQRRDPHLKIVGDLRPLKRRLSHFLEVFPLTEEWG
jgi:hypothetical protein